MRIVNAALQSTIMVDFLRRGITDGSGSHSPHNESLRIAMEIARGKLVQGVSAGRGISASINV